MTNLYIPAKQAAEIAEKANSLSEHLKDIATSNLEQINYAVDPLVFAITIFTLSCFIGYYIVWKVTPSLHTPLMAITNAISGIIIIGSLIAGSSKAIDISSILGYSATFLAAINIFGGFIVTERMLEMFKKK